MHERYWQTPAINGITVRFHWHTTSEVMWMAKAGMRRPDPKESHGTESNHKTHIPKNDVPPVPEIQGKAKQSNKKAKPV